MHRPRLRAVAEGVLLALVYVALARFGLTIHAVHGFATLVWPPTGVALVAILLLGPRFWPSIAAGALIANVLTGAPVLVAAGIAAGNTLEALVGALLLRRIPGFRLALDRVKDVIGLVLLAGVASCMVSATAGVASLYLGGIVQAAHLGPTWRSWWLGDAIGDLVVAPVLLAWPAQRDRSRLAEAAGLGFLLLLTSYWVFEVQSGVVAILSPLLIWASIRFELPGAARATFLMAAVAVWATARGRGPFFAGNVEESLFLLQAFVAVTAATFLVLGAAAAERRRTDEALRRTQSETEAASRAKDQFLAALSHELRTPLTPVLALSSALEHNARLPADARRQIAVVRRNAELEARLIDDLLDLTRISRGKLQVTLGPANVGEALDHVVEICREEAAAKGLELERTEDAEGALVLADPARLRQVLWNILKNAVKFTPAGGRVRLRTLRVHPSSIAIEVSDTGVGIEPSDLSRIFQPFEQAGRGRVGLGLGLAISKALVEAQGGTLTAESAGPGRGATFRVELKALPMEDRPKPIPRIPRLETGAGRPRRVLFVEDHADTAAAARELLAELSCDVVAAATLQEALAAAEGSRFDLVLSDLGLPDGSGFDLMRLLKDRYGLAGIAVTGYGMEEDIRRGLEAGFVDHLVKPITFQKLAQAIERFFAAHAPPGPAAER